MTSARWQLVVPVKPPGVAKSRLGSPVGLARAIARDTISAAASAESVRRVLVVTADPGQAAALVGIPRVGAVLETAPRGIAAAIRLGLAELDPAAPRGVLLGDLPALRPEDLDAALALAAEHDRAFVRDAEGAGTTLVTVRGGVAPIALFGAGSATRHVDAGLTELPIPLTSTLRRDVDTLDDLDVARGFGVGAATLAAVTLGSDSPPV